MKETTELQEELASCLMHKRALNIALNHLNLPITPERLEHLEDDELAYSDLLTNRFAKLQDTIGNKVFPLLLINSPGQTQT